MLALANRIWPRITSSNTVSPSSGTRRRTAPASSWLAAEPALGAVALLVGLDVVGGRGRVVRVAATRAAARAPPRGARRARTGRSALVPVEVQPAQRVEDLLDVLGGRSLAIGIFDPQHERPGSPPACPAGEQPVVQGRAGAADVQGPGRGWSEANAHGQQTSHANRRPRIERGRSAKRGRARHRARLRGDPDLQPVAADVATHRLQRGRLRRVPRGDRRQPDQGGADPRRVPAQLRLRGPRDARQVARLADPVAAGRRRDRRGRASCCTRARPRGRRRQGDQARRQGDQGGSGARPTDATCTSRTRRAPAARSGARSRSSRRCSTPPAAASASGVCLDSCHLFASGYDVRTAQRLCGEHRGVRPRRRAASASGSLHVNDSATRARVQPRPPRDHGRGRARREGLRRVPVRAPLREAARACSRPDATSGVPSAEDVALAQAKLGASRGGRRKRSNAPRPPSDRFPRRERRAKPTPWSCSGSPATWRASRRSARSTGWSGAGCSTAR